jgi:hypothetical protein
METVEEQVYITQPRTDVIKRESNVIVVQGSYKGIRGYTVNDSTSSHYVINFLDKAVINVPEEDVFFLKKELTFSYRPNIFTVIDATENSYDILWYDNEVKTIKKDNKCIVRVFKNNGFTLMELCDLLLERTVDYDVVLEFPKAPKLFKVTGTEKVDGVEYYSIEKDGVTSMLKKEDVTMDVISPGYVHTEKDNRIFKVKERFADKSVVIEFGGMPIKLSPEEYVPMPTTKKSVVVLPREYTPLYFKSGKVIMRGVEETRNITLNRTEVLKHDINVIDGPYTGSVGQILIRGNDICSVLLFTKNKIMKKTVIFNKDIEYVNKIGLPPKTNQLTIENGKVVYRKEVVVEDIETLGDINISNIRIPNEINDYVLKKINKDILDKVIDYIKRDIYTAGSKDITNKNYNYPSIGKLVINSDFTIDTTNVTPSIYTNIVNDIVDKYSFYEIKTDMSFALNFQEEVELLSTEAHFDIESLSQEERDVLKIQKTLNTHIFGYLGLNVAKIHPEDLLFQFNKNKNKFAKLQDRDARFVYTFIILDHIFTTNFDQIENNSNFSKDRFFGLVNGYFKLVKEPAETNVVVANVNNSLQKLNINLDTLFNNKMSNIIHNVSFEELDTKFKEIVDNPLIAPHLTEGIVSKIKTDLMTRQTLGENSEKHPLLFSFKSLATAQVNTELFIKELVGNVNIEQTSSYGFIKYKRNRDDSGEEFLRPIKYTKVPIVLDAKLGLDQNVVSIELPDFVTDYVISKKLDTYTTKNIFYKLKYNLFHKIPDTFGYQKLATIIKLGNKADKTMKDEYLNLLHKAINGYKSNTISGDILTALSKKNLASIDYHKIIHQLKTDTMVLNDFIRCSRYSSGNDLLINYNKNIKDILQSFDIPQETKEYIFQAFEKSIDLVQETADAYIDRKKFDKVVDSLQGLPDTVTTFLSSIFSNTPSCDELIHFKSISKKPLDTEAFYRELEAFVESRSSVLDTNLTSYYTKIMTEALDAETVINAVIDNKQVPIYNTLLQFYKSVSQDLNIKAHSMKEIENISSNIVDKFTTGYRGNNGYVNTRELVFQLGLTGAIRNSLLVQDTLPEKDAVIKLFSYIHGNFITRFKCFTLFVEYLEKYYTFTNNETLEADIVAFKNRFEFILKYADNLKAFSIQKMLTMAYTDTNAINNRVQQRILHNLRHHLHKEFLRYAQFRIINFNSKDTWGIRKETFVCSECKDTKTPNCNLCATVTKNIKLAEDKSIAALKYNKIQKTAMNLLDLVNVDFSRFNKIQNVIPVTKKVLEEAGKVFSDITKGMNFIALQPVAEALTIELNTFKDNIIRSMGIDFTQFGKLNEAKVSNDLINQIKFTVLDFAWFDKYITDIHNNIGDMDTDILEQMDAMTISEVSADTTILKSLNAELKTKREELVVAQEAGLDLTDVENEIAFIVSSIEELQLQETSGNPLQREADAIKVKLEALDKSLEGREAPAELLAKRQEYIDAISALDNEMMFGADDTDDEDDMEMRIDDE